jgi:hypothetical protein
MRSLLAIAAVLLLVACDALGVPPGEVIAEFDGEAEFEQTQPNGPGCEPVCWLAAIPV